MTAPQYAVLLSSASTTVYPDLVCSERHVTPDSARDAGRTVTRAQPGIRFTVMGRNLLNQWVECGTGLRAQEWLNQHTS